MHRLSSFIITFLVLMLAAATVSAAPTQDDLPAADWYAVTWVEATDTLHWINAAGEQVSIPRPQLNGEISQAQTRLHVSPNGRYLVVISPLNNGREGIGFYDFASGEFVQTHETQSNEVFMPAGMQPFSETSSHFAATLRDTGSGAWRVILFEAATGNASNVLWWDDQMLPGNMENNATWWLKVEQLNFDEGFNMIEVRLHATPANNPAQGTPPSYLWRIPGGNNPDSFGPDSLTYSASQGFDVHPMTGEIVYAWFDDGQGVPVATQDANTVTLVSGDNSMTIATDTSARLPRWLNDGDWVGYYGHNGALAPHWTVMERDGMNATPISPAVIDVHHTRDGFLTKNTNTWTLNHVAALGFEGFSEPGNVVFAPGSAFAVIYTTPANTPYQLLSVADPQNELFVVDDLQAVTVDPCGDSLPSRLTLGDTARVTYIDGTDLNIRTAPAGDYIMQIGEGSVVEVVEGSTCANGYTWWRLAWQSDNVTVGGWAAEGDATDYYLEPYNIELIDPPQIQPTNPPLVVATPQAQPTNPPLVVATPQVQPTNPPLVVAPPQIQPTNPPPVLVPVCMASPSQRLNVGDIAAVRDLGGTLAVYAGTNSGTPFAQLTAGTQVEVIGGPQCRNNGARMWQIRTQDGNATVGWVSEGFNSNYFLDPVG